MPRNLRRDGDQKLFKQLSVIDFNFYMKMIPNIGEVIDPDAKFLPLSSYEFLYKNTVSMV
jgi:hypothetical protein